MLWLYTQTNKMNEEELKTLAYEVEIEGKIYRIPATLDLEEKGGDLK